MAHHVYGNTYAVNFEQRFARTVWRYSDSRAATNTSLGALGTQTNYELFYLQFASIEPDPVKRDLLVAAVPGGPGAERRRRGHDRLSARYV